MAYRFLADAVVVTHFAFIIFVAVGGLLAWRWPRTLWLHVPAVAWGLGIVTVGYECPLTPLEKFFREQGGENRYAGGFVDRYLEDVIYPDRYTPLLRAFAAGLIAVGWAGCVLRRRHPTPALRPTSEVRGRTQRQVAPASAKRPRQDSNPGPAA